MSKRKTSLSLSISKLLSGITIGSAKAFTPMALVSFAVVQNVQAQEKEEKISPSDIFFEAHMTLQRAKELKKDGRFEDSWKTYHKALKYYKTLLATHGTWEKIELVKHRIKTTTAEIEAVEKQASDEINANAKATNGMIEGGNKPVGPLTPKNIDDKHKGLSAVDPEIIRISKEIADSQRYLQKTPNLDVATRKKIELSIDSLRNQLQAQAANPLKKEVATYKAKVEQKERELKMLLQTHVDEKHERKLVEDKLKQAEFDKTLAENEIKNLKKQLDTEKELTTGVVTRLHERLTEAENKQRETEKKLAQANKEIDKLNGKLAQAEAMNKELRSELAEMKQDRDRMAALLAKGGGERMKALINENMRLVKVLKEKTEAFEKASTGRQEEQERLKLAERDLAVAKAKLRRLQRRDKNYEQRVAELEDRLRDTNAELARIKLNPNAPKIEVQEATMLKKTITRMLTTQKRRKAAETLVRKTLLETYSKDKDLIAMFDNISRHEIQLTPREQEIVDAQVGDRIDLPPNELSAEKRNENIIRLHNEIDAYRKLARRSIIKNDYALAEKMLEEANELKANDFPVLMDLGFVQMKLNNLIRAEQSFKNGIIQKQNNPYAHYMLGLCQYRQRNHVDAQKYLERCVSLDEKHANAHFYLGNVAAQMGNMDKAEKHFQDVLLIEEKPEALFSLSMVYHHKKDGKQAKEFYHKALQAGYPPNVKHAKAIGAPHN